MWLPWFFSPIAPDELSAPPEDANTDRCPFYVADPVGLCEYCGEREGVHDDRALKGKL